MGTSDTAGSAAAQIADRELVFTRIFDAPRELVFEAWTDPRHLVHWWGPKGFTTTIQQMDVRPGGVWRLVMRGPDGRDYKNRIVFLEVVRPERLVYKHDPEPGSEPVDFRTTVTFVDRGGKTELTMRQLFPSAAVREYVVKTYNAVEGAHSTLARLAEHLSGMAGNRTGTANNAASIVASPNAPELRITRTFDAPRDLVFKMWTQPEHLARWWGPRGFTLPVCEVDLRPGGRFCFVMHGPDGKDYPFMGTFLDVSAPERLVFRGLVHDVPGHEAHTEVTFVEREAKTEVTVFQVYSFDSEEVRSGAPVGWNQSLDKLEEYLGRA